MVRVPPLFPGNFPMTDAADFFRSSLDQIIDLRHLLAILASRLLWRELEVAAEDDRKERPRPFLCLVFGALYDAIQSMREHGRSVFGDSDRRFAAGAA